MLQFNVNAYGQQYFKFVKTSINDEGDTFVKGTRHTYYYLEPYSLYTFYGKSEHHALYVGTFQLADKHHWGL